MSSLVHIIETIPSRFLARKSEGVNTCVHFDLAGDDPRKFTIEIRDNECYVSAGLVGKASCTVRAKSQNYIKLELGELTSQRALMTGKLKVSNISEMFDFSKCFIPFKKFHQTDSSGPKKTRKPDSGPLMGYRILDLTHLLPGPLATAMLADMGAEVIKIEDPDSPDYVRDYPPAIHGKPAHYHAWNRSKRSLALSLKEETGRNKFFELVETADVVVEQFRPGVMDVLGLGYKSCKEINSQIIYVSLTGYGQTGPMSKVAGHDLNYMALSGLLSLNKDQSGRPVIPGMQLADISSGSGQTIQAVMAALLSRMRTGEGQHVDISMTDGLVSFATIPFNSHWAGANIDNQKMALSGQLPNYNVYQTSDGRWMALAALEPKFWNNFCDLVDRPDWKEKIIPDDLTPTKKEVAELFASKDMSHWTELGSNHDICLTPILELSEVEEHQHFKGRGLFDHSFGIPLINQPIKFSQTPSKIQWEAPELGEDEV